MPEALKPQAEQAEAPLQGAETALDPHTAARARVAREIVPFIPFERSFPSNDGAELTRSYRPALERERAKLDLQDQASAESGLADKPS